MWDKDYNLTSKNFYEAIRNSNHSNIFNQINSKVPNFCFEQVYILYNLLKLYDAFDCKYIFYYELYEFLKKNPLTKFIKLEGLFIRMFDDTKDYIFLFRIIILLCYNLKTTSDEFTDKDYDKKLQFYLNKIDILPIMTNKYFEVIKKIRQDIISNIKYLPDIVDYNNIYSELVKKSDDETKLFYQINQQTNMSNILSFQYEKNIRSSDDIYFNNLDDFKSEDFLNKTNFNYVKNENIIDDQSYDLNITQKLHSYNKNMEILCNLESYLMKEKDNKNENNIKLYYKFIYLCYVNNIFYDDTNDTNNMYIIINSFDNYLKVNLDSKFYWIYLIYTNKYKTKLIDNKIMQIIWDLL
jgi:hypothetical protein